MANNTISQVEINGTTYDLLDANTLSAVSALDQRVTDLEDSVELINLVTLRVANVARVYNVFFDKSTTSDNFWIRFMSNNDYFTLNFSSNGSIACYKNNNLLWTNS